MQIPSNPLDRLDFYRDILAKCLISREDRKDKYQHLRSYFLFGSDGGQEAYFNKIQPTIQLLKSFIYSAETTKFNIKVGTSVPKSELQKVGVLSEEINDLWHDSDTDLILGDGTAWAFALDCIHIKTIWNGGIRNYLIDPENFGVFREDVPLLSRQEAVVQCYSMARSELIRELKDHPHREKLLKQLEQARTVSPEEEYPAGIQNIILSSSTPNIIGQPVGGITGGSSLKEYTPKSDPDLLQMYELYIWNDVIDDYQIITMADEGIIIYDRRNFMIPKCLPFTKFCPEPLPWYYWGQSFSAKLTPLQDWRTIRIQQIKDLLELQVHPPKMGYGVTGLTDEKMMALNRARGLITTSNPSGKIETFKPDIPGDIFREIDQIDSMFNETAGINNIMQGKSEAGVRARGHADLLARLSSSRPKQYALILEDALENIAFLMLRLHQENSDKTYPLPAAESPDKTLTFIAKQFTTDFIVKVDSHSSSPIFSEDHKADMIELFKAHAIDRHALLKAFSPADLQYLELRLGMMEAQEEARQQAQMAAQQASQGTGNAKGSNDVKNNRSIKEVLSGLVGKK